jgi:hypothetical protein
VQQREHQYSEIVQKESEIAEKLQKTMLSSQLHQFLSSTLQL